MSTSTRQRGHLYQRFFTLKKQSDLGVATGLPDGCDKSVALKGYSPGKLNIQRDALTDAHGAGREFPYRTDDAKREVSLSDGYDATPLIAAYIAGFAFGEVSTVGASAPYAHTFKAQSGVDLPVTSVIDKLPSGYVLYQDLCLSDFSLSGSGSAEQIIQMKANWRGSGAYDDASATFSTYVEPALTRSSYCRMGGLGFKLGAFGAETEMAPQIERFEYGFDNQPFDGHRPGTGMVAGWAETGARRAHRLSFEALRDAADTLLGHYKNKTPLSLILTLKADDYATSGQEIEIAVPQLEIVKCDPTGGDSQSVSVEAVVLYDPDGAGYSASNQSGAVVTVKNDEGAHLETLA